MRQILTLSLVTILFVCFREISGKSFGYRFKNIMGQVLGNTVSDSRKYYEHPKYEVETSFEGFELRKYSAGKWTSANIQDTGSPKQNGSNGFRMLFSYITGKTNEQKQSVSMTVPVLMQKTEDDNCKVSFYLPEANADRPPTPSDPNVFTDEMAPSMFYVRGFSPPNGDYSHFIDNKKEMEEAMKLQGFVLKDDYKWIRASYDAPFKLMNRHSEVWIAKDQVNMKTDENK